MARPCQEGKASVEGRAAHLDPSGELVDSCLLVGWLAAVAD
jgi:hypothetical protein